MTVIAFLRHGETSWNRERRIQGHTDIPLTDEAKRELSSLQVPAPYSHAQWFASPLRRAQQTADALGLTAQTGDALIEMHWGKWEGQTLFDLHTADPDGTAANEARGLHFRPEGGESPWDVRNRVLSWARALPSATYGAVTHKGVMRAALSSALDWDMTAKCPAKIDWTAIQVLRVAANRFEVEALNVPLEPRP